VVCISSPTTGGLYCFPTTGGLYCFPDHWWSVFSCSSTEQYSSRLNDVERDRDWGIGEGVEGGGRYREGLDLSKCGKATKQIVVELDVSYSLQFTTI